MGDNQAGQNVNMYIIAGFTILISIVLHFIYKLTFGKKEKEAPTHVSTEYAVTPSEETSDTNVAENRASGKNKKRAAWKGKTEFNHPWLLKNLKGHPGNILNVDFSANGKFMAVACDETCEAMEATGAGGKRRVRRRPPPAPPSPPPPPPPTSQRISIDELHEALQLHILSSERMWALGYPMEIEPNSSKAVVYVNPPPKQVVSYTMLDVNAPVFVPGGSQSDSGRGSMGSTPRSESDEETDAVEHSCARCDKNFRISRDGEYLSMDACAYHWGRMKRDGHYMCCDSPRGSNGCSVARFHVWTGTRPGMNGPLEGYVQARLPRGGVYALDAEMCFTTAGLELAKIAVVGIDGRIVYKSLVKPSSTVLDHNTRFSGIRPRDLARATKTLKDVQNDILGFVGTDTILVGHALENDLRALKLMHSVVVDTCALYPHERGFPLRRSLRALSEEYLQRKVQCGSVGHSPVEDARAAIDLVLLKVRQENAARSRRARALPSLWEPYDPLVNSSALVF